jgi:hypothetical protein
VVVPEGRGAGQPCLADPTQVIDRAHKGIERFCRPPHLAYGFLGYARLSVA